VVVHCPRTVNYHSNGAIEQVEQVEEAFSEGHSWLRRLIDCSLLAQLAPVSGSCLRALIFREDLVNLQVELQPAREAIHAVPI